LDLPPLQLASRTTIGRRIAALEAELQALVVKTTLSHEEVHALRVCTKKLRSWLALLAHTESRKHHRKSVRYLKGIARGVAVSRELNV
jgi:regulator of replication initiation timing